MYKELAVPHSERITELSVFRIVKGRTAYPLDFPVLSRKAAQARHLLPVLCLLCSRKRSVTPEEKLRLIALESTERFFEIIETADHVPSAAQAAEALSVTEKALRSYCALARLAIDAGKKMWNVTTKFHYWWHAAYFCKYANPRKGWAFKDEDFVGRLARIGHACIFGTSSAQVSTPLVFKYLSGLRCRFTRRRRFVSA